MAQLSMETLLNALENAESLRERADWDCAHRAYVEVIARLEAQADGASCRVLEARAHMGLARTLLGREQPAFAADEIERAIAAAPAGFDPHMRLLRGLALELAGRWSDAIVAHAQAAAVQATRARACERLAVLNVRLGRTHRARAWLRETLGLGGPTDDALFVAGWLGFRAERWRQCLSAWGRLARRRPHDRRCRALVLLGRWAQSGDGSLGRKLLDAVPARGAGSERLRLALALQLFETTTPDAAGEPADSRFAADVLRLAHGGREAEVQRLEEALRRNPLDRSLLHALGLIAFNTACRLEEAEGQGESTRYWTAAIAAWAALLEDDGFWEARRTEAKARYQAGVSREDAEEARERLGDYVRAQLPEAQRRAFRRERRAAAILRRLGGLQPPGAAGPGLIGGPALLALCGLEGRFGSFVRALDGDPGDLRRLRRAFSQLGEAQALFEESRPQEALAALAGAVAAAEGTDFGRQNPAYAAYDGGPVWFRRDASALAVEAHQAAARAAAAEAHADPKVSAQHWSEALALAAELGAGAQDEVRRAVADTALGRCQALERAGKLDEAVALIETAQVVVGEKASIDLEGRLCEALTVRGVKLGNAGRLEEAVADLRRAHSMNPQSLRVATNLATALGNLAGERLREEEPDAALDLLREADRRAREALDRAPGEPQLKDLLDGVQVQLAVACAALARHHAEAREWGRAMELAEEALRYSPECRDAKQVKRRIARGFALERAEEGQLDRAFELLEEARRQFPEDATIRRSLAEVRLLMEALPREAWR